MQQSPMPMPPAMAAPQEIQPAPAGDPTMQQGQAPMQPPPAQPTDPMVHRQFDAPIPGQSLTGEPGNANYEKPPQFADLNKALNYLWDQIIDPQHMPISLAYMDKGVPPEMLADITIFAGFTQGKWTPDVGMMMKPAVVHMFAAIAYRAGIRNTKLMYSKDKTVDTMAGIYSMKLDQGNPTEQPVKKTPQEKQSGFMARIR
jgi:hypothetical protein